jgi:competence protein ComGC
MKNKIINNTFLINCDEDILREINEYLDNLNDLQIKAYNIALNHLGSSFNILKSNGFIDWKKSKKK